MGRWKEIACYPVAICSFYLHGKAIKLIIPELNISHLAGAQSKRAFWQPCFLFHRGRDHSALVWSPPWAGHLPIFYFTHMKTRLLLLIGFIEVLWYLIRWSCKTRESSKQCNEDTFLWWASVKAEILRNCCRALHTGLAQLGFKTMLKKQSQ